MGNAVSIQQAQETTVVQIPFHNQHAGVVRLVKHFGDQFIGILKTLMTDVGSIVSSLPNGKLIPEQVPVTGELNHDGLVDIYKGHVEFYRPTQLTHLKPIDFHIDEKGDVSLVCELNNESMERGIPKFVKAVYNNPVDLVDDLISGKEEVEALWDFIPCAFVGADFGA